MFDLGRVFIAVKKVKMWKNKIRKLRVETSNMVAMWVKHRIKVFMLETKYEKEREGLCGSNIEYRQSMRKRERKKVIENNE